MRLDVGAPFGNSAIPLRDLPSLREFVLLNPSALTYVQRYLRQRLVLPDTQAFRALRRNAGGVRSGLSGQLVSMVGMPREISCPD